MKNTRTLSKESCPSIDPCRQYADYLNEELHFGPGPCIECYENDVMKFGDKLCST
jgi:hypothetical protein